MNTDRIAYFLSIAETGSFSAAARKHYISQTAVSQQVAALEKELGSALFLRTPDGAMLTEAGRRLLPLARATMDDYRRLREAFSPLPDEKRVLTVACMGPVERSLLGSAFLLLNRDDARIELRPLQFPLSRVAQALEDGECDLALTIPSGLRLSGLQYDAIAEYPTRAAVSIVNELAHQEQVTLAQLQRYPFVTLQSDGPHSAGGEVQQWARDAGFALQQILTAESIETQLFMVSLDLGVSLFPDSPALHDRKIRMLDVVDFRYVHTVVAVYRARTPGLDALLAALRSAALHGA